LNHAFSISPTLYQAFGKRGAGRECQSINDAV
jgi:hypothetical protein